MSDQQKLVQTALHAIQKDPNGFETKPKYCARFVKQVHLRVNPDLWVDRWGHPYNTNSNNDPETDAYDLERNMLADGKRVALDRMDAGDVVFFNRAKDAPGRYGHVALYVGDGRIAENSTRTAGVIVKHWGALKLSYLPERGTITSVCRLWVPDGSLPDDDLPTFEEVAPPIRWCWKQGYIIGDGQGHFVDMDLSVNTFDTIVGKAGLPPLDAANIVINRATAQAWLDKHFAAKGIRINMDQPDQKLRVSSLCYILSWIKS